MGGRAARTGAPTRLTRGAFGLSGRGALTAGVCLLFAACGSDRTQHIAESYQVVGGQPSVDPAQPTVDKQGGQAKASDFGSNAPSMVDAFVQTQVAKVDILWVIDDSGSMASKQNKVKTNFQGFIQKLVENSTPVDYHIGIVTTDTYNLAEAGRLQNHANLSRPWIGKDTCGAGCDPVATFRTNAGVGTSGSGDEKPLLAAEMALTPPLSTTGYNAGFLRDDAALFVIILSDEEDSSCAPARPDTEGCLVPQTFGSTDYYARFFEGLKGYGRKELVTVGAIVGTTQTESLSVNNLPVKGCRSVDNQSDVAIYSPRTIDVATRTGGLATNICDANYLPALQNLGFLATGAKTTFFLTRAPYPADLKVYVTKPGQARTLQQPGVDYDYEPCAGSTAAVKNAIEFRLGSLPPSGATIEAEYPVNVRGVRCPP